MTNGYPYDRDDERKYFCFEQDYVIAGFTIPKDVPIQVKRHLNNSGEPDGQYNYCFLFIIGAETDYSKGYFKPSITYDEEVKMFQLMEQWVLHIAMRPIQPPVKKQSIISQEELGIIAQALGIGEKAYSDLRQQAVNLATVRGMTEQDKTQMIQQSLLYWDHACRFTDVGIKIKNLHDENIPVPDDLPELKDCYFCRNTGRWTGQIKVQTAPEYKQFVDWCEFCELSAEYAIGHEFRRLE